MQWNVKWLSMGSRLAAAMALGLAVWSGPAAAAPAVSCSRFPAAKSTAFDGTAINLPWRGDLPATPGTATHAWQSKQLTDWQGYMAAVLGEVRASGVRFAGERVTMDPTANWWISPWMDYTANGRERNNGLTRERGPNAGDLAPGSLQGPQVWAVGFYNREGASAFGKVFADPCDPVIPAAAAAFPVNSASFKLLFTNAGAPEVAYLAGAPTIKAFIDGPAGQRTPQDVRLLQVDIAVRDARSPTGWVFGTYLWKGPKTGDGLIDNLVPVGLMWGNDPTIAASPRDAFATLAETRLNPALAGVAWRGPGQTWAERPWPGFQGRLNGPADNLRSSCLSCHALAQWPRSKALGIVPSSGTYSLTALNSAATRDDLRSKYFKNVAAGALTNPADATPTSTWGGARSLDYSLQLDAAFTRMCGACRSGDMTGATPALCRIKGAANFVSTPTCKVPSGLGALFMAPRASERPARQ